MDEYRVVPSWRPQQWEVQRREKVGIFKKRWEWIPLRIWNTPENWSCFYFHSEEAAAAYIRQLRQRELQELNP